jgi:hypothetical protein
VHQEASDETIELHEDNPGHFRIMLEYIYTHQYVYEAPSEATDLEKRFPIPIGLHTLADKYDVEGLAQQAVSLFSCSCWNCTCEPISDEECEQIVKAHYDHSVTVDSVMGKAIASYILEKMRPFMYDDKFDLLVYTYPFLGADIVFAEKRRVWLSECTRAHKETR